MEPADTSEADRRVARRTRVRKLRADASRPARAAAGVVIAVAILAPQLLGGAFAWAVPLTAAGSAIALVFAWWATRASALTVDVVLGAVLLGVGWTAVQRLPLPCGVVELVARGSVEHSVRAAELLGEPRPSTCTISIAPGNTTAELVKGLAIACMFVAASLLVRGGQRRAMAAAVGASAGVMAAVTIAHLLAGQTAVFGFYTPREAGPTLVAPLLNSNHLGGFLGFGAIVLVALALEAKETARLAWLSTATIVVGTTFLTLSRGAVIAILLGMFALGVTILPGVVRKRRKKGSFLAATGAAAVGLALGAFVSFEALAEEVRRRDLQKLVLGGEALRLVLDAPLVGFGRGGFAAAFLGRHSNDQTREYFAENIAAQWGADWGLPIALAITGLIAWGLVRVVRGKPSSAQLGTGIACATLYAQNLVDFGLEMVGIAVVAAVALAVATQRSGTPSEVGSRTGALLPPVLAGVTLLAVATLGPLLLREDRYTLLQTLSSQFEARDHGGFATTLRRAVNAHPAEPEFAVLAGSEAAGRRDASAIAWLNRAMQLAPGWSSPHSVAVYVLIDRQRDTQAMLEVAQIAQRHGGSLPTWMCQVLEARPDAQLVLRTAPSRREGRSDFLEAAARCLVRAPDQRRAVDAVLGREFPELTGPKMRAAADAMAARDADRAIRLLEPLVRAHPADVDAASTLAQALLVAGRPAEVIALANESARRIADPRPILQMRARAEAVQGNADAMRTTVEELRVQAAGSAQQLAATMQLLAELESQTGNPARALRAYEEAYRFSPSPSLLAQIAGTAESGGNSTRAFTAYSELCLGDPNAAQYCAARDRLAAARRAEPAVPGLPTLGP